MTTARSITLVEAGVLTTVQDLGRPGLMRFGVSPGGAIDRRALILGNRLTGNAPATAALEVTLIGPRLRFSGPTIVAITGADLGATVAGEAVPRWEPVVLDEGDELVFIPRSEAIGARAYVCIAGGIAVEPVMGSRATDLFGGFGGWEGRALRPGDTLPLGEPALTRDAVLRRHLAVPLPAPDPSSPSRVVLGPQGDRFTDEGIATLLGGTFAVSPVSDRMGMRLTGATISHASGADLISEGIAHGAIQVPGDGHPIVLLAARQTVGGYPKIATVIGADLDALGQRRPGDPVCFVAIEPAEARAETLAYGGTLGADAVVERTGPGVWHGVTVRDRGAMVSNAWDAWSADAVARLVMTVRDAGVSSLRLEVDDRGATFKLELSRDDLPSLVPPVSGDAVRREEPGKAPSDLVTAPLLGVFYRRPAPDQPPFAEVGQTVTSGQTIGVLEVMKTYHEVVTPHDGVLKAFLIEDGAFVEFGQPLARVAPA